MKIKFSPMPLGCGPDVPFNQWIDGTLSYRDDGKLQIAVSGGFIEFRWTPNDMFGVTPTPNTYMAGCEKGEMNTLVFPNTSDRPTYDFWPTYAVVFVSCE